jgi:hypothetical protein
MILGYQSKQKLFVLDLPKETLVKDILNAKVLELKYREVERL